MSAPPMSAPTISVAMATYDGARHLREQLDSLAAQETLPLELVVSDDGSTDGTLAVVEAFAARAPFPVRVLPPGPRLGYGANFLRAARACRGEWIAFCDQDDVWLPHRIAQAAAAIRSHPDASLVLQKAVRTNADLTRGLEIMPTHVAPGRHPALAIYGVWVWPGFLQTIPARLVREADPGDRLARPRQDGQPSHDLWDCMVANALGDVVVLDGAAALWRRHDAATSGPGGRRGPARPLSRLRSGHGNWFRHRADLARDHADFLREVAERTADPLWRDRLRAAAPAYERFAALQAARARLHEPGRPVAARLRELRAVARGGGYLGPRFLAMGARSFAKDLVVALLPADPPDAPPDWGPDAGARP